MMKEFEMKTFKTRAAGAFLVAAAGFGVPAVGNAFIVNSSTALNSTFTVNYLLAAGATDPNGNTNDYTQDLTGSVLFTLISFNSTTDVIRFQLDVRNTTALEGNDVGLQSVAFGTDPDATAVSLTQITGAGQVDEFTSATLDVDSSIENSVKPLVLDIQSSTGNGYADTLQEGELDKFFLDVSFLSIDNGVSFTPFSSKWQTDPDSFQIPGTGNGNGNGGGGGNGNGNGNNVPEPGSLALLGIGLLAAAAARRRQRI